MSDYPDPWGPGGKFIDSGLQPVAEPCPRCGAPADQIDRVVVPRPLTPGDPVAIRCRACSKTTWLNMSNGQWDLSDDA